MFLHRYGDKGSRKGVFCVYEMACIGMKRVNSLELS